MYTPSLATLRPCPEESINFDATENLIIEGDNLQPHEGEIILFESPDGVARVEVFFEDETFWLSQRRMAELFGVEVNTVNYHLKEIYRSAELVEGATIRRIRTVQQEGGRTVARELTATISMPSSPWATA